MDYIKLIDKYYGGIPELRHILVTHSRQVADRALSIIDRHPEWEANGLIDRQFVEEAAMLHEIGIVFCDAPGILCKGTEPYIRHGYIGAEILRKEGLHRHARVAERHTGSGLTKEQIIAEQLPLPEQDFLPETIEEKVICYADKFFSKSHPERIATPEHIRQTMLKFGYGSPDRWAKLEAEMM